LLCYGGEGVCRYNILSQETIFDLETAEFSDMLRSLKNSFKNVIINSLQYKGVTY